MLPEARLHLRRDPFQVQLPQLAKIIRYIMRAYMLWDPAALRGAVRIFTTIALILSNKDNLPLSSNKFLKTY